MDYCEELKKFEKIITFIDVEKWVREAVETSVRNRNEKVYRTCFSCIDITSLNVTDNRQNIHEFTSRTAAVETEFPGVNNVASVCVYPCFVETVGLALGDSDMRITSVAGGFPSSQTYLEVKMLELAMAIENGADEIDIVLNVGQMLAGEYELLANDIELMRRECGEDIVLKVIIESGALEEPDIIRKASLLSMLAGTDFVKTSTGKIPVAATPEAAVVICDAIRDYYNATGRKVGFKAAGGVRTTEDAALYYTIVENILGSEWLTPELFRIGASSAANNLLGGILGREIKYF